MELLFLHDSLDHPGRSPQCTFSLFDHPTLLSLEILTQGFLDELGKLFILLGCQDLQLSDDFLF